MTTTGLAVVKGHIVTGDQRGRDLGFPTANLAPADPAELDAIRDGVYAGWLVVAERGEEWPAAISVGTNPTFAGTRSRRAESYVLDRDDLDLVGAQVTIRLQTCLRGMIAFSSVEALIQQMHHDVWLTREVLELPTTIIEG